MEQGKPQDSPVRKIGFLATNYVLDEIKRIREYIIILFQVASAITYT
jgi:hypothetical protein